MHTFPLLYLSLLAVHWCSSRLLLLLLLLPPSQLLHVTEICWGFNSARNSHWTLYWLSFIHCTSHPILLRAILILSSHLFLVFQAKSLTKYCLHYLFTPYLLHVPPTFLYHFNSCNDTRNAMQIKDPSYKFFSNSPATSSHLGPSTMLPKTWVILFLKNNSQISKPYKTMLEITYKVILLRL